MMREGSSKDALKVRIMDAPLKDGIIRKMKC